MRYIKLPQSLVSPILFFCTKGREKLVTWSVLHKPVTVKSKSDYFFFHDIQKENCQQVFASFANTGHSLYTRIQAPAEQTQYI